jgi:hypothetical protein
METNQTNMKCILLKRCRKKISYLESAIGVGANGALNSCSARGQKRQMTMIIKAPFFKLKNNLLRRLPNDSPKKHRSTLA